MNKEIEQKLRELYLKYCKDHFYQCFQPKGFTIIGDEKDTHITFLNFPGQKDMCINYPNYTNHWHPVRWENDMDKVFEECIAEAYTKDVK